MLWPHFCSDHQVFLTTPPPYLKMNDVSKMTVQRSDTELDHKRNNVGKNDEKTERFKMSLLICKSN